MVGHETLFSTPRAFDVITDEFESFCARLSLTVLSRAVVRHWCWEWAACQTGELDRYVAVLSWEEPGRSNRYQLEFWADRKSVV